MNPECTRGARAEDAKCLARKVNAMLVSEINMEDLLDAIRKARRGKISELPDGAENLTNMIIKL
ncbi:MAG: hypothetical protein GWN31_10930 [Candidatus Thorarchaeota archaeon]|nr:hypothetical protein [Candidatus Thorarchaeota archaeon]NIW14422.1 hypothetical protein [Candidatus Thorarchaeota archaeon]